MIIRLSRPTSTDRVGGKYFGDISSFDNNSILYFGIDPFTDLKSINLAPFAHCRKVASISDLHHGTRPFTRIFDFLHTNQISGLLIPYNPKYADILSTSGFNVVSRVIDYGYIGPISTDLWLHRKNELLHTGRLSSYHEARNIYVNYISRKLHSNFIQFNSTPQLTWQKSTGYKYALNLPLSGDRNCRFWEILLSGSLLFQPKLDDSQYSDLTFPIRKYIVEFDHVNDLLEKYTYYKNNPLYAQKMAYKACKFAWSMFMNEKISDICLVNLLANRPFGNPFLKNKFDSYSELYNRLDESSKKTYLDNLLQSRSLKDL